MMIKKWLSDMAFGYRFDFYADYSLEKCLDILNKNNTWIPYGNLWEEIFHPIRRYSGYRVAIKSDSDNLHHFEIQSYRRNKFSSILVQGTLYEKDGRVRVVGMSRIQTIMGIFLVVYGVFALIIFSAIDFLGAIFLIGIVPTIIFTLFERYRKGLEFHLFFLKQRGRTKSPSKN